jgi:hypothetical protein
MFERRAVICLIVAALSAAVLGLFCMLVATMLSPLPKLPFYASGGAETGNGLSLRVEPNGAIAPKLHAPGGTEPEEPVATIPQLLTRKATHNSTHTIETLPGGRSMVLLRYFEQEKGYLHWAAYEITTGTKPFARMLLHHVSAKTLRQRSELELESSIWATTPVFYGNGFFWTGPRMLVLGANGWYRASTDVLQYALASFKRSWLMWFATLCAYISGLAVAAGIFRSAIREITQNVSIILWVLIGLRLLWALIYRDVGYTLAWLSPVIIMTGFVTAIYLFHLQHFRRDSVKVDDRLRRRRRRMEI